MKPTFSIIIPCFNQEKYIEECINSVLNQTFINWECIIVNDGSTDNCENIILEKISGNSQFKYFFIENNGVSAARNFAISHANGNYILPLDGDDKIGNEYLSLAAIEFKKNPNTKLVYCLADLFGSKNEYWPLAFFNYNQLLLENHIFCSVIFSKKSFLQTDGYDTNLKKGYEDWEFLLQLIRKDDQVIRINSVEFYYRQLANSRNSFIANENEHIQTKEYIFNKHAGKIIQNKGFKNVFDVLNKIETLENELLNKNEKLRLLKKTFAFKVVYKIEKEFINLKRRIFRKWKI